jgi:hypothetical protein
MHGWEKRNPFLWARHLWVECGGGSVFTLNEKVFAAKVAKLTVHIDKNKCTERTLRDFGHFFRRKLVNWNHCKFADANITLSSIQFHSIFYCISFTILCFRTIATATSFCNPSSHRLHKEYFWCFWWVAGLTKLHKVVVAHAIDFCTTKLLGGDTIRQI